MIKKKNDLLEADKLIIDSYKLTMEGLAAYYGDAFEFVLHDLTDYDHSIVKIINGHHSGRKDGGPITDFALSMLEQIQRNAKQDNGAEERFYTSYMSASKYGKPVRSTTMVILGAEKRAIGLLCINLYLDSPISSLLRNFSILQPHTDYVSENFFSDANELIVSTMEQVKRAVNEDAGIPPYLKNKEIVTQLYHQGIFKLRDAVLLVARDLGISKNTVYLHIRPLKKNGVSPVTVRHDVPDGEQGFGEND